MTSGSASITSSSSYNSGVTGVTADNSATLRWTVSNGTCTAATDDVVLSNNSNPTASASTSTGTVCEGTAISLTGGASGGLEVDIVIHGWAIKLHKFTRVLQ